MDPCLAHLMDPPVQKRALLQGKVLPDVLEGTIAWYLLPTGDKPGDVIGIYIVALIVGNGIHDRRHVEKWKKRGIVGFLVKAT